jgi:hypothetical protein
VAGDGGDDQLVDGAGNVGGVASIRLVRSSKLRRSVVGPHGVVAKIPRLDAPEIRGGCEALRRIPALTMARPGVRSCNRRPGSGMLEEDRQLLLP